MYWKPKAVHAHMITIYNLHIDLFILILLTFGGQPMAPSCWLMDLATTATDEQFGCSHKMDMDPYGVDLSLPQGLSSSIYILSGCQMLKIFGKRIGIKFQVCLYEKYKYIIKFP